MPKKIEKAFIKKLIEDEAKTRGDFRKVAATVLKEGKSSGYIRNIDLFSVYQDMLAKGEIKRDEDIERLLVTKRMRSASGVSVVTVLTKPYACPGKCIYCPTQKDVPKSYLADEPAVMRAILADYDAQRQVETRLKSLSAQGHPIDKVEVIVIGGTFNYLPKKYQEEFIKGIYDGLNEKVSKNLGKAQKLNEEARRRCVGLTLETRPDFITEEEVAWFRELGATRVELGVQSTDDDILKKNCRGHSVAQTIKATKLLKDAGFKICWHLMPNLYGSSLKKDKKMFREVFKNPDFRPDYIKIYPTMVIENTSLFDLYKKGEYKSYTDNDLIDLICDVKVHLPYYVRIMRTIRDIPAVNIQSGSTTSNLRQVVLEKLNKEDKKCHCIRCREAGLQAKHKSQDPILFADEYEASGGTEYFLSYESPERKVLYSLLRLRLTKNQYLPELKDAALIREVHTYGREALIGEEGETQHTGFGKKLIAKAEQIASQKGYKKITVISAVGTRGYYQKIGYQPSTTYMVKQIL